MCRSLGKHGTVARHAAQRAACGVSSVPDNGFDRLYPSGFLSRGLRTCRAAGVLSARNQPFTSLFFAASDRLASPAFVHRPVATSWLLNWPVLEPLRYGCSSLSLNRLRSTFASFAGKFLAAGTTDGNIFLYDVEQSSWDHRTLPPSVHTGLSVLTVAWTRFPLPRSRLLAPLRIPKCSYRPRLPALPADGVPYTYPPMEAGAPEPPDAALERDAADFVQVSLLHLSGCSFYHAMSKTCNILCGDVWHTTQACMCCSQVLVGGDSGGNVSISVGGLPLGGFACNARVLSTTFSPDSTLLCVATQGTSSDSPVTLTLYDTIRLRRDMATLHQVIRVSIRILVS